MSVACLSPSAQRLCLPLFVLGASFSGIEWLAEVGGGWLSWLSWLTTALALLAVAAGIPLLSGCPPPLENKLGYVSVR